MSIGWNVWLEISNFIFQNCISYHLNSKYLYINKCLVNGDHYKNISYKRGPRHPSCNWAPQFLGSALWKVNCVRRPMCKGVFTRVCVCVYMRVFVSVCRLCGCVSLCVLCANVCVRCVCLRFTLCCMCLAVRKRIAERSTLCFLLLMLGTLCYRPFFSLFHRVKKNVIEWSTDTNWGILKFIVFNEQNSNKIQIYVL